MAFPDDGTHPVSLQGGTFNNIAGDMNIVNTVSVPGYRAADLRNRIPTGSIMFSSENLHTGEAGLPRARRDARYNDRRYETSHSPPSFDKNRDDQDKELPLAPIHSSSTFNTVAGNMTTVNLTAYGDNGLDILYRSVLKDAMHNSAERPADPACHPRTRNSVLNILRAWSQDDSPDARLLWLYGSAGMGKSAIAQTFAAKCQDDGILGASFFFKRGDVERGNWKTVFPTLAYQLAASYPQFGDALRQAIEKDKLVLGQAMRHQFQKLIVGPFEQTPPLLVPPIIVIDGLDECADHPVQVMLLNHIIGALRTGAFPVRLLLASRPEAHLREILDEPANFDVCRHLELHPDPSAYADIRRYLYDEFSRIYKCHTSRGVPLGDGWPGEGAINHLVTKSSGTFIYATTVVRHVDDEYSHPVERLDSILALDPHSTAPLDTLYNQVLSTVPNRSMLRRVLHAVANTTELNPEDIDVALQLRAGTSRLVLRGLHSLLFVPPVRRRWDVVKLLHASFGNFLRDPARSLDLCFATPELDYGLLRTMSAFLSSSPIDSPLFRHRTIATELLSCIVRVDPTQDLLPVLGLVDIQHTAWSNWDCIPVLVRWLQSYSPLPCNLVQTWEDLEFVSRLRPIMTQCTDGSSGTLHDSNYAQILSQNPQVLSVLRVLSALPGYKDYTYTSHEA
ncbi:hypothetical protein DFH06DRAFT_393706, partial [Mycena polygramma]